MIVRVKQVGSLHSPLLKKNFILEIFHIPVENKCGYFFCISRSSSQVASANLWCFQSTFTNGIILLRKVRSFHSNICIGSST